MGLYKTKRIKYFFTFLILIIFSEPILGVTHYVTTNADSGPGTLRDFITISASYDTIRFDTITDGVPIYLLVDLKIITPTLTIIGNGIQKTLITSGSHRFCQVYSGTTVSFANIKFYGGWANGEDAGAIFNQGHLICINCVFQDNGAYNNGGAIMNYGSIELNHCTFSNNHTVIGSGGGIYNVPSVHSSANIYNTTFLVNTSAIDGGAIWNGGDLNIVNCTLSQNYAINQGGGIFSNYVTRIFNSTITLNVASAPGAGGGVYGPFPSQNLFKNSILSNNSHQDLDCFYIDSNSRNNIVWNGSIAGTSNQNYVNPMIGPLGANGGMTETHPLLCGSPAINAGVSDTTNQWDQKGIPRNSIPDIGAYEFTDLDNTVNVSGDTIESLQDSAQYQWYNCSLNNQISGETSQTFSPTVSGSYAVIISNNGCIDTSVCNFINISNISNEITEQIFQILPNIVNDELRIKSIFYSKGIELSVFNLSGLLIAIRSSTDKDIVTVDCSSLSPGFYIIEVRSNGNYCRKKFLKM
ncbi:MAG: T9SS type A sorting domain-containing protein [Bacteroidetes bacterium]|nr:T9SS type A sorting domain-containing protein [Bacteroidota bacterium]